MSTGVELSKGGVIDTDRVSVLPRFVGRAAGTMIADADLDRTRSAANLPGCEPRGVASAQPVTVKDMREKLRGHGSRAQRRHMRVGG
jgi:hypothetical protein